MDVVAAIAAVPAFVPSERIRQFNGFAELLGDERAAKGRATWFRPLRAIVIDDCGVMPPETEGEGERAEPAGVAVA